MTRTAVWTTLAFFMLAMLLPACSENMPTEQKTTQPEESTEDFTAFEQAAERYEHWIAMMDPFVLQTEDGTYIFDQDGFLGSLGTDQSEIVRRLALSDEDNPDSKVILELMESISVGNEQIRSEKAALGHACWNYWWGRRCCYWGTTGWQIVAWMAAGAAFPPWGYALTPFAAWAGYFMQVYNGFCANGTWVGGMWLTAP